MAFTLIFMTWQSCLKLFTVPKLLLYSLFILIVWLSHIRCGSFWFFKVMIVLFCFLVSSIFTFGPSHTCRNEESRGLNGFIVPKYNVIQFFLRFWLSLFTILQSIFTFSFEYYSRCVIGGGQLFISILLLKKLGAM